MQEVLSAFACPSQDTLVKGELDSALDMKSMTRCKDTTAGSGWQDEANVTITPYSWTLSDSEHIPVALCHFPIAIGLLSWVS